MNLPKCLVLLPIFLATLLSASASKSVTEITIKPPSSKFLAKLMGIKKQKTKPLKLNSKRLPKMGFLASNGFSSMMDDDMITATPRQDIMGFLNGASRLSSYDNSPIYYVRLPPTPYMYTPGLGYISQHATPQLTSPLRTESYHGNSLNPLMNLPVNFLSNGQPNGAYDFSMPELLSSVYPGKGFLRQEPPIFGRRQFVDDSKFSSLKGRYDFNGRPEGVYMLPDSPFYQSSMFK